MSDEKLREGLAGLRKWALEKQKEHEEFAKSGKNGAVTLNHESRALAFLDIRKHIERLAVLAAHPVDSSPRSSAASGLAQSNVVMPANWPTQQPIISEQPIHYFIDGAGITHPVIQERQTPQQEGEREDSQRFRWTAESVELFLRSYTTSNQRARVLNDRENRLWTRAQNEEETVLANRCMRHKHILPMNAVCSDGAECPICAQHNPPEPRFPLDAGGSSTLTRLQAEVECNKHKPEWTPATDTSLTCGDLRAILVALAAQPHEPSTPPAFTYKAFNMGNSTWMVKRFRSGAKWEEALIEEALIHSNPIRDEAIAVSKEQIIQAAIKRDSWA